MLYRYMQVGSAGEKAATVIEVLPKMQNYQFLYLHDEEICIVDAKP